MTIPYLTDCRRWAAVRLAPDGCCPPRFLQRFGFSSSESSPSPVRFSGFRDPSAISTLSARHPRLSSATSQRSANAASAPSRVLGRRGFVLHSVTRFLRPRVISTIRGSESLCSLTVQGSPLSARFYGALGFFRLQSNSASRGKTRCLLVSHPAPVRFVTSSDFGTRFFVPARPSPRTHLAGSLFAMYTSSASCFLQTRHLCRCPCLVGVVLPSGNGGPSCSRLRLERRPVRHARHTSGRR